VPPIEPDAIQPDHDTPRIDPPAIIEAWRQAHFAAQAAAELGKSWAVAQDDDSHSSFSWAHTGDFRGLEGVPAAGDRPLRARLRFEELELSVVDERGAAVATLHLEGATLPRAVEWIGEIGDKELGPRRQPARPAPDLPDHPLAAGATFEAVEALAPLADLYEAAAQTLEKLRAAAPAFDEPRCWPHHFDLASLAIVGKDGAGEMVQTIGVGVTPPDSLEGSGYLYVSPWMKNTPSDKPTPPALDRGRWLDRGEGPPMAILPINALESSAQLAAFIASAVNACKEMLDV